jgi:hypothetical protein
MFAMPAGSAAACGRPVGVGYVYEGDPMDTFLSFIESSDLSMWIRGESMLAFPTIITVHTICMGLLAGTSSAIDLRILGVAPAIPMDSLRRFYPMMWLALAINAVTGVLMVIGYPTKQLTNPLFYIKLSLVGLGVWLVYRIGVEVLGGSGQKAETARAKWLAWGSLATWVGLIIAGRLLEYTHKWELLGVRALT